MNLVNVQKGPSSRPTDLTFKGRITIKGLPKTVLEQFPSTYCQGTDLIAVVKEDALVLLSDTSLEKSPVAFFDVLKRGLEWFKDSRSGAKLDDASKEIIEKGVLTFLCQDKPYGLSQGDALKLESYTVNFKG
ncbi:MAG: hypothetical protein K2X66_14415 [Cyanobacteria bacterium]|nr:hypothetical protein [Cyanobacteriota bacterium]